MHVDLINSRRIKNSLTVRWRWRDLLIKLSPENHLSVPITCSSKIPSTKCIQLSPPISPQQQKHHLYIYLCIYKAHQKRDICVQRNCKIEIRCLCHGIWSAILTAATDSARAEGCLRLGLAVRQCQRSFI